MVGGSQTDPGRPRSNGGNRPVVGSRRARGGQAIGHRPVERIGGGHRDARLAWCGLPVARRRNRWARTFHAAERRERCFRAATRNWRTAQRSRHARTNRPASPTRRRHSTELVDLVKTPPTLRSQSEHRQDPLRAPVPRRPGDNDRSAAHIQARALSMPGKRPIPHAPPVARPQFPQVKVGPASAKAASKRIALCCDQILAPGVAETFLPRLRPHRTSILEQANDSPIADLVHGLRYARQTKRSIQGGQIPSKACRRKLQHSDHQPCSQRNHAQDTPRRELKSKPAPFDTVCAGPSKQSSEGGSPRWSRQI